MRKVIYLMNVSLDGFVEGPDDKFGWTEPDEEVFRFHIEQARAMGAFIYGRRIYEAMAVWQTMDENQSLSDDFREYARIWKEKPKIFFSTTLQSVVENCLLVRGDIAAELASLRQQPGCDLGVCGPGLASGFARLDLIDEYRLVVYPIILGGGKPYFPSLDTSVRLRLLETRTFRGGAAYLRYQRV